MDITIGTTTKKLTEEEIAAVDAYAAKQGTTGEPHLVAYVNAYIAWLVNENKNVQKKADLAYLTAQDAATVAEAVATIKAKETPVEGESEAITP